MNQQIILILNIVLSIFALFMAIYAAYGLRKLHNLKSALFLENQPENLELILEAVIRKIKALEDNQIQLGSEMGSIADQLSMAVQKVGMKRFNSFPEEGGNLSFSLALLDDQSTGVVITSLHGRQHNRIYAKPVENGRSNVQLNEEEKSAIGYAQEQSSKQNK